MTQREWEDYVEARDKLEALDRVSPHHAEIPRLLQVVRDFESQYDKESLHLRYDDPEKEESKQSQIASYERMYLERLEE